MFTIAVSTILVIGLAIYALRRPPVRLEQTWPLMMLLLILALTPISLWAGLHLFFGVAESLGGELSIHLGVALPLLALMYLMWRQPLPSGVVLTILSIIGGIEASLTPNNPPLLLIAAVFLLPGLLLLAGVAAAHRNDPRLKLT